MESKIGTGFIREAIVDPEVQIALLTTERLPALPSRGAPMQDTIEVVINCSLHCTDL